MAKVTYGNLPPADAIKHLRAKLNITTEHWDDMMGDAHAKAFTIAGATKLALLADMRQAVEEALVDSKSFGDFKKQFNDIVAKHGWDYKGGAGWRAKIIYDTNMRPASKWAQIQSTKNLFIISVTITPKKLVEQSSDSC